MVHLDSHILYYRDIQHTSIQIKMTHKLHSSPNKYHLYIITYHFRSHSSLLHFQTPKQMEGK